MTNIAKHHERARQLLLTGVDAIAFAVLSDYVHDFGDCPSCGAEVERYEADILKHSRTCPELRSDAAETNN